MPLGLMEDDDELARLLASQDEAVASSRLPGMTEAPPPAPTSRVDVPAVGGPMRAAPTQAATPMSELARLRKEVMGLKVDPDLVGDLERAQSKDAVTRGLDSVAEGIRSALYRRPARQQQAPSAVDELGQRQALAKQQAAQRAAAADNDANSEASRSTRSLLAATLPGVAKQMGPQFERMSHAKILQTFPFLKEIADNEAQKSRSLANQEAQAQRTAALVEEQNRRREEDYQRKLEGEGRKETFTLRRDDLQGGRAMERAQVMASRQDAKVDDKKSEDAKGYFLDGWEIRPDAAPTPKETQDIRKAQATTRTVRQTIQQIENLYRQFGTQALPSAAKAKMRSLTTDLQLAMKGQEMYGLGVITGPDLDLLNSVVATPTSTEANVLDFLGGGQTLTQLKTLSDQVGRRFENSARSMGYRKPGEGGGAPTAPGPASTAPATQGDGKVVVQKAGKQLRIPKARLADAAADGWTEVR